MLVHFKVETCSSIDPIKVCTDLFDLNRCLCVLHKGKHENPHWHFQGETERTDVDAYIKTLTENHSKRIAKPTSRPAKRMKTEVTEDGYQYMLKESPPVVVWSSGHFTPEIIAELHEKSQGHVQELKQQMYYYVIEKLANVKEDLSVADAKTLHGYWRRIALSYYLDEDKMPPPNFQKLVLWYMAKYYTKKNRTVREYVSSHI